MNVIFRADSSLQIGTGHVARCLSLARALARGGAQITFVCRDLEGSVHETIAKQGFGLQLLPRQQKLTPELDAEQTIAALNAAPGPTHWVIVDHYGLDARWERAIAPRTESIMAIDDLADRPHDCAILLDQNLFPAHEMRYQKLVPAHCRQLLGPRYALIAENFQSLANVQPRSGVIRRILVSLGGSDAGNETGKVLEALGRLLQYKWQVDVVIGASNPNLESVRKLAEALPLAKLHVQTDRMAELMLTADLAIGAGGTTSWERCRTGLPCVTIAVVQNQVAPSRSLAQAGHTLYLGESAAVSTQQITEALETLAKCPELVRHFSLSNLSLVDGQGARRVAQLLMPAPVILRQAREQDCDAVYEWRNAEEVRQSSFASHALSLEEHRSWFAKTLANPNRALLIGSVDGSPIGVLRFDFAADATATVSIYLVPGHSGRGLGTALLGAGSSWIRKKKQQITELRAEIRPENAASKAAFLAAGYTDAVTVFALRTTSK